MRSITRTARRVTPGIILLAVLSLTSADLVRVLAQQPGTPPAGSEPDIPEHCACEGGICPVGANGRGCGCGCALAADEQPVQALQAQAAECTGGQAGGFPCQNVDLLAFLPMADIGGGHGNDLWGWTDPRSGREYAIVGRTTGTAFVEVTDPAHPVYVGELPTQTVASTWRDVKVFGNYAYIVSEAPNHGMQVFDLTALASVEEPPQVFTATAHYGGFGSAHNLAIDPDTGFAFALGTRTCAGGPHMVDLKDALSPTTAGCYSLDGYTHDAQCAVYRGPDPAYQGREICFNANEDTLTIVDVSDKHDAREVSRTGYDASAYTHQGWLTEDQHHFLVDDEGDERAFGRATRTFIWDVTDLAAPFIAAIYEGPVRAIDHNLYVRGDLIYEANYRSGLRVLAMGDLAGGVPLREVGFFDVYPSDNEPAYNGAWSVYPFFASGTVIVNGIEQGLFVLRPRRAPVDPVRGLSVSIANASAPAVVGRDVTYVATARNHGPDWANGVQLVLQPPAGSSLVSTRVTTGTCSGTQVVTCDVGWLPPGTSSVATIVVRADGVRDITAAVKVTADPMTDDPADNTATVVTRVEAPRRELVLRRPNGGDVWLIGRAFPVQWVLRGVDGGVRVELSRDDGRTWMLLSEDAPNTGFFDWPVEAPRTSQARVRVTSVASPSLSATTAAFSLQ